MVLNKIWFQEQIDNEENPAIKLALERVFEKYTQAPDNTSTKLKEFDADETFLKVSKYYVDIKKYSIEQANEIAKSVVLKEQEKRGLIAS